MRRREFASTDPEVRNEILDRVPYGHLATLDARGHPVVKPLNFVRVDDHLYFHRSPGGEMSGQLSNPACFVVAEALAWIPSTFRHPELACPATTYYRSVLVRGTPVIVGDSSRKATILEAFMSRFQPEGGHLPIDATDDRYRTPVAGVMVFGLPLESATIKVKVGQHLPGVSRRRVFERLLERNRPGDFETAAQMARHDRELPDPEPRPLLPPEFRITGVTSQVPADQLKELLDDTYWAAGRSLDVVRRSLEYSYQTAAILAGDRLAGFARVVGDGATHGWILDVVVHREYRGQGLGHRLLEYLLQHPRVSGLPKLMLHTRDAQAFYAGFGFAPVARVPGASGPVTLMIRPAPAPEGS